MVEPTHDADEQLRRVSALGDPTRRMLYHYVAAQGEPVDRDQAASGTGVARHTAKFHLDRLEAEGLLETDYARPAGRGGPGAGRPAKRYRRAAAEVAVTLPARRYDLAGTVLARAVATAASGGVPVIEAVRAAAAATGREIGEGLTTPGAERAGDSPATREAAITAALAGHGYEPRASHDRITLTNCPFDHLADRQPELICDMNLHLIEGLLSCWPTTGWRARLEPGAGRCCVTLNR